MLISTSSAIEVLVLAWLPLFILSRTSSCSADLEPFVCLTVWSAVSVDLVDCACEEGSTDILRTGL